MRVCMRVCAWVRGCAPILLTLAKWYRMQPEPEHKHQGDHQNESSTTEHRNTSTEAGAPQAPSARV